MILLEFQINYVQQTEQNVEETRLTTFIKVKLKKSYDQKNINKYRVTSIITEYHHISKIYNQKESSFQIMMMRQLYHVKKGSKNVKNQYL